LDDNDTPYQMPAFSGRNILVFSDASIAEPFKSEVEA
jgi:hypothetical protein